jgi:DNA-binding transcriptional MerR regulator
MARDVDKGPDAYRTISEVADDLDLPQHVLRFWEGRFPQIKPLKRGGGRRYYRPDDVELLRGIRHLLYGEGYTIRGVQRILKEQGVRFVMGVWRGDAPLPPPRADERDEERDGDPFDFDDGFAATPTTAGRGPGVFDDGDDDDGGDLGPTAASIAQRFAPRGGDAAAPSRPLPTRVVEPPTGRGVVVEPPTARPVTAQTVGERAAAADDDGEEGRSAFGALIDRFRPSGRSEPASEAPPPPRLSREDVRHLQATLFELLECKRLLDQAR